MKRININESPIRNSIIAFFVTGFGFGLLPKIPGTWGTLGAALVYYLVIVIVLQFYMNIIAYVIFVIVVTGLAITLFYWTLKYKIIPNPKNKKPADPGEGTIDEFAGFFIATLLVVEPHWLDVLALFFIFRFFDIAKPFPIRKLENLPWKATAVVMDDVAAGIYTAITWKIGLSLIHLLNWSMLNDFLHSLGYSLELNSWF
jgi:phosphatidylglycerophosphatase A